MLKKWNSHQHSASQYAHMTLRLSPVSQIWTDGMDKFDQISETEPVNMDHTDSMV